MPEMYNRRDYSSKVPSGASGEFNLRGEQQGHATQYYDDNTRLSWDTNGVTDTEANRHWTDQNARKGSPERHNPPPHAR